jgi:GH24 family phage-related lysozyme (muramidase)
MASNSQKVVAGLVLAGASLLGAMTQWERPPEEQRIAEREGSAPSVVYADKLAGGLPTVCGGHTDWKLRVGTAYTKEQCAAIDSRNAERVALAIIKCTGHTEANPVLNQNRLDGLTLMGINVGEGSRGVCGSRAVKLIKAGKFAEGCRAIAHGPDGKPVWSYTNGGKTFVKGLYNRRVFESEWCARPMPKPQALTGVA